MRLMLPKCFLRTAAVIFMLSYASGNSVAQNAVPSVHQTIRQMYHRNWTVREGLPKNITQIAQSKDGFLWLASEQGLYRFDGVSFRRYAPPTGISLLSDDVVAVMATREGGLWLSYQFGGATFIQNGNVTNYSPGVIGKGNVVAFAEDLDGAIWATTGLGLSKFDGKSWKQVGDDLKYGGSLVYSPQVDQTGTLWIWDEQHMWTLKRGARAFEKTQLDGTSIVTHFDQSHREWLIGDHKLQELRTGSPSLTGMWIDSPDVLQYTAIMSRDGSLWFGTKNGIGEIPSPLPPPSAGLDHNGVVNFGVADGLASVEVRRILEDQEGDIWVLTARSLEEFRPTDITAANIPSDSLAVSAVSMNDALVFGDLKWGKRPLMRLDAHGSVPIHGGPVSPTALHKAKDGSLWVGSHGRLWHGDGVHFTEIPLPEDQRAPSADVQAITVDDAGVVWVSILGTGPYRVFRLEHGTWSPFKYTPEGGHPFPLSLLCDRAGTVHIGYSRNRITSISKSGARTTLGAKDGLDIGTVIVQYEHGDEVWVGGTAGLGYVKAGRYHHILSAGDPFGAVSGIAIDSKGDLWLNTNDGIVDVDAHEVELSHADPSHAVRMRLYNYLDGVQGTPAQVRPLPTITAAQNGRLYFSEQDALLWVDPDHLIENTVKPNVFITAVTVDGKSSSYPTKLKLPEGAHNLQLDYTATSLSVPERVLFRYRLKGFDTDWQEPGTRRQAFYSNLPPGIYTFQVIASNDTGLWNLEGASAVFTIPPTFIQTLAFKLLLLAVFLVLLYFIFRLRLNLAKRRIQERVYERFAEREAIARDLHDTLFQGVEGSLLHLNAITSRLALEEQTKGKLQQAYSEADRVMKQARSLVFTMRQPTARQDLAGAIRSFADQAGQLSDAELEVIIEGRQLDLKPVACDEILKIIQECVWNAFRHAKANRIEVRIIFSPTRFEVHVLDDGIGIDPAILEQGGRSGHWGMTGIRERVARLKGQVVIRNREEGGAQVSLQLKASSVYLSRAKALSIRWLRLSGYVDPEQ